MAAQTLAQQQQSNCCSVILINGRVKVDKSVSNRATMAYYTKPLTFNSQTVGYIVRCYPSPWTVLSSWSGSIAKSQVLGTFSDDQILVPGTNTPDLLAPGQLVQQQQVYQSASSAA